MYLLPLTVNKDVYNLGRNVSESLLFAIRFRLGMYCSIV